MCIALRTCSPPPYTRSCGYTAPRSHSRLRWTTPPKARVRGSVPAQVEAAAPAAAAAVRHAARPAQAVALVRRGRASAAGGHPPLRILRWHAVAATSVGSSRRIGGFSRSSIASPVNALLLVGVRAVPSPRRRGCRCARPAARTSTVPICLAKECALEQPVGTTLKRGTRPTRPAGQRALRRPVVPLTSSSPSR